MFREHWWLILQVFEHWIGLQMVAGEVKRGRTVPVTAQRTLAVSTLALEAHSSKQKSCLAESILAIASS